MQGTGPLGGPWGPDPFRPSVRAPVLPSHQMLLARRSSCRGCGWDGTRQKCRRLSLFSPRGTQSEQTRETAIAERGGQEPDGRGGCPPVPQSRPGALRLRCLGPADALPGRSPAGSPTASGPVPQQPVPEAGPLRGSGAPLAEHAGSWVTTRSPSQAQAPVSGDALGGGPWERRDPCDCSGRTPVSAALTPGRSRAGLRLGPGAGTVVDPGRLVLEAGHSAGSVPTSVPWPVLPRRHFSGDPAGQGPQPLRRAPRDQERERRGPPVRPARGGGHGVLRGAGLRAGTAGPPTGLGWQQPVHDVPGHRAHHSKLQTQQQSPRRLRLPAGRGGGVFR